MNDEINELIENEEYIELLNVFKKTISGLFKESKDLTEIVKVLVLNGYGQESMSILNKVVVIPSEKDTIKYLKKLVLEYEEYYNLSDELKGVYEEALLKGSFYKKNEDYETAYDIYSWAYYLTGCQIFIYYMGKSLYFNGNVEESRECDKEYLKSGAIKYYQTKRHLPREKKKKNPNKKDPEYDGLKRYMQKALWKEQIF